MRGFMVWIVGVLTALAFVAPAVGATAGRVKCPLPPGAPSGGDVQWAFSDSGRPAGKMVASSYLHGRGHWTHGRATGTVCTTDSPRPGGGVRDLVLVIRGTSRLTGRVTQNGRRGVQIVLPITVRASDDKTCAPGATGTITLFASYYAVHRDTMRVTFRHGCSGHSLSYSGADLHVYIARHGAQVTTP